MSYIYERERADCKNCPLDGCQKVWGRSDKKAPPIAIFGEAPGAIEEQGKPEEGVPPQPFIGPAGRLLRKLLHTAGIPPHIVHFGNVICCRPPKNDMESEEGEEATLRCARGFQDELLNLVRRGTRIFIPVGNVPLTAFGVTSSTISKARGSIYELEIGGESCAVLPTFHPSYLLRGGEREEVTVTNDLEKANRIARQGWSKPEENFVLFPTLGNVRDFLGRTRGSLMGLDAETTSLDPDKGEILMVGLADSGTSALVIPFYSQGMVPYWSFGDRREVSGLLRDYLEDTPVLIQNALFDMGFMERAGWPIHNLKHDIMLISHAIHPELPHRLGYIVSQYGSTPYWKDIVLESNDLMYNTDDQTLRTYNARDAVVLHQVLNPMLADLEDVGTGGTYDLSMALIKPVQEMMRNGLLLDKKKQTAWRNKTKRGLEKKLREIRDEVGVHEELSLESPDDLRWLVHKIKPKKYRKALVELPLYDEEGSRRKKDSKKYRKFISTIQAIEGTKPLIQTSGKRKTDGGQFSTDAEAMLAIQIASANRLEAIGKLVRRNAAHEVELEAYNRLLRFVVLFRDYQKLSKILSTYTNFPMKEDGRVKGQYLIHGTSTGRFSCVSKDTMLDTTLGRFKISEYPVCIGAKIQTHSGAWEPILRKIYKGIDKMYRVSVSSGHSIECTDDHRLLTEMGWVRVKDLRIGEEVLSVCKERSPIRSADSRLGSSTVHKSAETHTSRRGRGRGRKLPDRYGNCSGTSSRRQISRRESVAILQIEDGREEPNDWKDRVQTSSVERPLLGSEGASNPSIQWAETVRSPLCHVRGNGDCAGPVSPRRIRSASYRREWREQRSVQFSSRNNCGPSKLTCELAKVVAKTPLGSMGVWDIEVQGDHSYVAHGLIHHNSKKPNMQNIPAEARHLFIAEEGYLLVEADYSSLELRVLAEVAGDDALKKVFADGKRPHVENCKALFKIDEKHPTWKLAYRAAKIYVFGRNYGGSLRRIFEEVATEVPDLKLTFRQFKEIDSAYWALYPRTFAWRREVIKQVEETRRLTNAFGRVRYFLGDDDEIKREGLNFPIQSTAADIMNHALIHLVYKLPKEARLCASIHDSVIVECPKGKLKATCKILHECMEEPVMIDGEEISFPVDIKVGTDWGNMNDLKTRTV